MKFSLSLLSVGFLCLLSLPVSAETPRLPDSCLLDFRNTLETPAGQHGTLTVGGDGHFHWEDGTRARFWGINVSSTRLDIPNEQIEQVVETFARAGLNLVRLEAVDNRNCLLGSVDAPDSRHFDKRYLDRLDRWMDALRRHGIYYYLDLLDFRTFKNADGVLNADSLDRGARPYAVFDPYLIQLQKEYATHLLTHRNPYSHLRPVDDPALAMVEICNEHGFFLYPDKLEALVEPYHSNLRALWNRWLNARYTSREQLDAAWGDVNNAPVLAPIEDLAHNNIELPLLTRPPALPDPHNPVSAERRRAPSRLREGVEFLVSLQRDYFRTMRAHLRTLGLRVPVTAVVSSDVVPDVASVAQECDFTSENWYGDGANDDPRTPGTRYYSNRNPILDDSSGGFAPFTAALRWNNKPVVIREWAVSWPNRARAASVPEALAYSALQDYDAVLLFGYQTNRAPNGAEADALNDYAFQSDPAVWGLYALAGQVFLKGVIRPAAQTVTLAYPASRRFAWPNGLTDLHRSAYSMRVESVTEDVTRSDFVVPTGTNRDLATLRDLLTKRGKGKAPLVGASFAEEVWRSDTGQITRFGKEGRLEVRTPSLRIVAGAFDPTRVYDLGGGLCFSTPTRFGALLVYSLDGEPVERSKHVVAKMVSRAENSDETLEKALSNAPGPWALRQPGHAPVLTFGHVSQQPTRLWLTAPSRKKGAPATTLRTLLTLYMTDGTWEMELRNNDVTLACDADGMVGNTLGRAFTTVATSAVVTAKADSGGSASSATK